MSKMIKKVFNSVIKEVNIGEKTLTAVISTDATDRMGESVLPEGIDQKNFRKNPVVVWAHDYSMLPIGKAEFVKRSGNQLISRMKFADHEFANEVFNLYKDGFLKAFSIGFIPKEWEDGDGKKTPYRTYKKWELLEYSAVPIPANPEALQLAVQRGIVHEDRIIDDIQKSLDDEENEEEKEPTDEEIEQEEQEEEKQEDTEPEGKGLEELLAENKLLAEEVNGLKNENADLRWQIYSQLQKQEKQLSDIAELVTVDKVQSTVERAIRKIQGKVD